METILISLLVAFIFYLIIAGSKSSKASKSIPSNNRTISVNFDMEKTMKELLKYANNSRYKIGYTNFSEGIIVLEDELSFASNCNYPIFIKGNDLKTNITIGIRAKGFNNSVFIGATSKLENIVNGIHAHFYSLN